MNRATKVDAYGILTEPNTVKFERILPGPIEGVWAYVVESDLRRQWFAGGVMELKVGATCEFVRRNDELTDPSGSRPDGIPEEIRNGSRITTLEVPRAITFTFGVGLVSIQLAPKGEDVQLTLIHSGLPIRATTLRAASSWHMHLDILASHMGHGQTEPFWVGWSRLYKEYDARISS